MKTNKLAPAPRTAPGTPGARTSVEDQLRRSVMACMLWEDNFYEDGVKIAERIETLVGQCNHEQVRQMAVEAREKMKLRHVPLWLCVALARKGKLMAPTLTRVIQRADELTEFLALYAKGREGPKVLNKLSKQVKLGLAAAFHKFDAYQLAKYDRREGIKLRDVLRVVHPKPHDEAQAELWRRLQAGTIAAPDTWEVELTRGKGEDKAKSWQRLLKERKLGGLAFIRNLRNMLGAGIEPKALAEYAETVNLSRVLPFRFIAAARAVPQLEDVCDAMLFRLCGGRPKLPGKTVVIVDVSGSMSGGMVSRKSDLTKLDAAGALAAILRELCEFPAIYATAGNDHLRQHKTAMVPGRRGMALVDCFNMNSSKGKFAHDLGGGGIFLQQVCEYVDLCERKLPTERLIVLTDEQDCSGDDPKLAPAKANQFARHGYIINVASERTGIGYGPKWTHIDGWSEHCVDFIQAVEGHLGQDAAGQQSDDE